MIHMFEKWMNNWFGDNRKGQEDSIHDQERLEYLETMKNKEKINLECEGKYYYKVKLKENCHSHGWNASYAVYMIYNINVTLEGELESVFISGEMEMVDRRTERECYEFIVKSMEIGAEPFMKKLEQSVIRDYKTHLADNNIKKLKDMVKNNKPISVSFTVETTK